MRPVDADVVDLVFAVAEPHDAIDDAACIGCECGLRRPSYGGTAIVDNARVPVGMPYADEDKLGLQAGFFNWYADFAVPAAPRVKGTTAEAVFVVPADGCRMTCAAVIVALSTVPITSAV